MPGVSSPQHLNVVLGPSLASSAAAASFSNAASWRSQKLATSAALTFGRPIAIVNPNARFRRRALAYVLNLSVCVTSRLVLCFGRSLGRKREAVTTARAPFASFDDSGMLTALALSGSLTLTLSNSGRIAGLGG